MGGTKLSVVKILGFISPIKFFRQVCAHKCYDEHLTTFQISSACKPSTPKQTAEAALDIFFPLALSSMCKTHQIQPGLT